MIQVKLIKDSVEQDLANEIRRLVFVAEQKTNYDEEFDEFETSSRHFLALDSTGQACGTARWRYTKNGIKLERFAVLKDHRGKGVGSALVKALLDDVATETKGNHPNIYLHAQVTAMPLYSKYGFKPVGELFLEVDIEHYKMELKYE
jgi:predicted GNAT family N-acyltransferase